MRIFKLANICIFIIGAFCTISYNCSSQAADDQNPIDIYLLIGQSNMAGRAPIPPELDKPIEGAYVLDANNQWIPAKPPLNLYSTIRKEAKVQRLNPGVSFAMKMVEKFPDVRLGLVVNAKGGSNIGEWNTRDAEFYKEALRRLKIASKNGRIKGILWHQGEANCNDARYVQKVSQLIQNFREDLNMLELPFIAGQINGDPPFNKIILALPDSTPLTAVASTDGLKAFDKWHFDTPSMITLGERYAERMIALQNATKILLEAEDAQLTAPMAATPSPEASGGKFVSSPQREAGSLAWSFDLPKDGNYTFWVMAKGIDANKDSFYFTVDDSKKDIIDVKLSDKFIWQKLEGRINKSFRYNLKKGRHIFKLFGREANAQIDKVLVTASPEYYGTHE